MRWKKCIQNDGVERKENENSFFFVPNHALHAAKHPRRPFAHLIFSLSLIRSLYIVKCFAFNFRNRVEKYFHVHLKFNLFLLSLASPSCTRLMNRWILCQWQQWQNKQKISFVEKWAEKEEEEEGWENHQRKLFHACILFSHFNPLLNLLLMPVLNLNSIQN